MCEQYNGWANRETWATALWIDNDYSLNRQADDYTCTTMNEHCESDNACAIGCLAETLENWITEDLLIFNNVSTNRELWAMANDIGSLYRVNWREIAENYLSEAKEEAVKC